MGATISGEIEWWGCRPGISAIQRGFRASDSRGRQQVSAASMSIPAIWIVYVTNQGMKNYY